MKMVCFVSSRTLRKNILYRVFFSLRENLCYEIDKRSISMFEILEPGGQVWANTAFEGSQFHRFGVPKFYS